MRLPSLERRGWIQHCWRRGGCALLPSADYSWDWIWCCKIG